MLVVAALTSGQKIGLACVGGAFILFGGWYLLSARKWFKGPVRMGTDEELERLEEEQLGQFELPTESPA